MRTNAFNQKFQAIQSALKSKIHSLNIQISIENRIANSLVYGCILRHYSNCSKTIVSSITFAIATATTIAVAIAIATVCAIEVEGRVYDLNSARFNVIERQISLEPKHTNTYRVHY